MLYHPERHVAAFRRLSDRLRDAHCRQAHVPWLPRLLRSHGPRSEEHTSELQSHSDLVCRLLLEKKKTSVIEDDLLPAGLAYVSDNGAGAYFFFFNDTATTEIYTLSLHDALPTSAPAISWP